MKSIAQEADFFDTLISRCCLTRKDLVDCVNTQHDEIANMEDIFDLRNEEDFRRCLAIPHLLDPLAADEIIAYFRDEERNRPYANIAEPDMEKYQLLLVTAFFFNTPFFAMAWNWCALIRQELQLQMLCEQNEGKPSPSELKRLFPEKGTLKVGIGYRRYIMWAAAGTEIAKDIGCWPLDIEGVLFGHLWINVTADEVRFLFKFETYSETAPCFLRVECKTKDGKIYPVVLNETGVNDAENKELIIMSDTISGFDYSDVEILEVKIVEND